MVNPRPERSRLGDLLVEMRLVDQETISAAVAEHRASGRRLPRVLADRHVLDEERLAKAVAAKLGLEAVNVSTLKIHERVLQLIPVDIARKYGVLPIAIKRTNQSELLYLVMVDPLDTEAIGEVQRLTGRQVRVLMATSSDVDLALNHQYRRLATTAPSAPDAPAPSATGSVRPPPVRRPVESSKVGPRPSPPSPTSPPIATSPPVATSPPIVRGTPAGEPDVRPRYPAQFQRTLIDSARPPELDALALPKTTPPAKSSPNLDDELVVPQDLDPPDSVRTRIDPEPFSRLLRADAEPAQQNLQERDWDLAVSAWDDVQDGLSAPAASTPDRAKKPDPVTTEASLEHLELVANSESEGDDGEDLKTSQLELSEVGAAEFRREIAERSAPDGLAPMALSASSATSTLAAVKRRKGQRTLASTLEVPIEVRDDHHPFDGPSVEEIPIGLERTGIIPAIDWDRDEFVPPPLGAAPADANAHALVGTSDIPMSDEAVRARATELGAAPKPASEEDVIEAIEEVSLEPLGGGDLVQFEEPEEYGGSAAVLNPGKKRRSDPPTPALLENKPVVLPRMPAKSRSGATPSKPPLSKSQPIPASMPDTEDSDADKIPVIEPSSLMSLMDDDADDAAPDTGADAAPFGDWQDKLQAPATRLFDESNRQVVQAPLSASSDVPSKIGQEDEPTNPRIDTSSVQAALAEEQQVITDDMSESAPIAGSRAETTVDRTETVSPNDVLDTTEDPTPSEDTVDRDSVLSALDGAFWEPAPEPKAAPEPEPEPDPPIEVEEPPAATEATSASDDSMRLANALIAGDSLTSAERALLVLSLGRLLIKKGVLTREELAAELDGGT